MPTLTEYRHILQTPLEITIGICDAFQYAAHTNLRGIGRSGKQLLQCCVHSEADLCGGYTFGEVDRALIELRHRRTVFTCGHKAQVVEILPQLAASTIDGCHVDNLVAETLVCAQSVEVPVPFCVCAPMFHLGNVVEYHAQCVRACNVEGEIVHTAFDDAAGLGGDTVRAVLLIDIFLLVDSGVCQYFQGEVVLNCGHARAKHPLMGFVVLVAGVNKEFILQPIAESLETRVEEVFNSGNIVLGDTHAA